MLFYLTDCQLIIHFISYGVPISCRSRLFPFTQHDPGTETAFFHFTREKKRDVHVSMQRFPSHRWRACVRLAMMTYRQTAVSSRVVERTRASCGLTSKNVRSNLCDTCSLPSAKFMMGYSLNLCGGVGAHQTGPPKSRAVASKSQFTRTV